jgi:hypothetical protein
MNTQHRYTLEKGSKKHQCPSCEKKRFVRYIDTQTGEYIPIRYGRCDREMNCGYHSTPYQDGYSKASWAPEQDVSSSWKARQQKPSNRPQNKPKRTFIPIEVLKQTCEGYEQNTFIQNLLTSVDFPLEPPDIENIIAMYHLGTVQYGHRSGATTFPFIDVNNKVRAIQVKQFDEKNHTTGTDFLHSIIEKYQTRNKEPLPAWLEAYNKNETKVSCLFGDHLLTKYPHNPVALVEAPKTAVYGTLYFGSPEQPKNLLWLAVYNLSSLNLSKCKSLKGRSVYLFPDLSKDGKAFQLWSEKAALIQKKLPSTYFQVSDLLERYANDLDKERGKDIADYLIKQDWRLFRKEVTTKKSEQILGQDEPLVSENRERSEAFKTTFISRSAPPSKRDIVNPFTSESISEEQPENWNSEITELQKFFDKTPLPAQAIKLNGCSTIIDCRMFIRTNLTTVIANNGRRIYLPYLQRLQSLKRILTDNSFESHRTDLNDDEINKKKGIEWLIGRELNHNS